MARREEDWAGVLEELLAGDRAALVRLTRLVNSFLVRWNAYDFRDEWDDLVQEVVLAAATALREGRLRERGAAFGYLRSTARFKFADRLRHHVRHQQSETLPWEQVVDEGLEPELDAADAGLRRDLLRALERLSERERQSVVAVHVRGQTYEEAAETTGIPLGSLKRSLRSGLAALRASVDLS